MRVNASANPPIVPSKGHLPTENAGEVTTSSWMARIAPSSLQSMPLWIRLEPWAVKLTELVVSQGCLQLLMAISGFLLLRWMPVREYAVFTLAFAIQSTMLAVVDMGFSNAIVPLVGGRIDSPEIVGSYVVAARKLRGAVLPFVLAGGAVAFMGLGHRQAISTREILIIFFLSAVTLWFNAINAVYSAPIVIRQQLRVFYRLQNGVALLRLVAYAAAHFAQVLLGAVAVGMNTLLTAGLALAVRSRGQRLVVEPTGKDSVREARRDIIRFVTPQIPIVLFNAIEGQIMIFLISLLGHGAALADIGALARLNMLFAFTPSILGWVVQPYFSKIEKPIVRRRFWQILAVGGVGLTAAPLIGFLWPRPFLWLLGPKYGHLGIEVGLLLLAGALGVLTGLVATLSSARKWVYADAIVWIAVLTVGLQAIAIAVHNVSLPAGSIAVMIWGNIGSLIAYLWLARRGLRAQP